jgi:hypothetical protein
MTASTFLSSVVQAKADDDQVHCLEPRYGLNGPTPARR